MENAIELNLFIPNWTPLCPDTDVELFISVSNISKNSVRTKCYIRNSILSSPGLNLKRVTATPLSFICRRKYTVQKLTEFVVGFYVPCGILLRGDIMNDSDIST